MAGDIVGYSRRMAENEAETYADLRSVFDDLIEPVVSNNGGRIFKNTGDGFLAIFSSVNQALDAALEIQKGFAGRKSSLRLGINLGDIIDENGDMFGDGVNVASRLESIAEPGSVYVSSAVVQGADRSRGASFRRVGRRRAKNLPEPIDVYALKVGGDSRLGALVRRVAARPLLYGAPAAACVLIVAGALAGGPAVNSATASLGRVLSAITGVESAMAGPAVAVLPFDNMSGDQAQDYFADGLTEDIITELARNPDLQVIARNSTFAVRDQALDVRDVARQLGVGYVVEGSARRSGDQLRVVAQLIDARTGAHLWSRSYDRRIEDVFAVQAELTAEIVSHLASYVRESEVVAAAKRPTESLQAYDLVLQARERYRSGLKDPESLLASRALFQRALEIDPGYAAARAGLGLTFIADGIRLDGETGSSNIETGLSEARQAIRLDPNLAQGYQVLSFGLASRGDYSGGIQAARRAVDLNPNDPDSLMALAKAQVRYGEYDDAVSNAARARQLHPLAPEYYVYVHGQALYAAGKLDEAEAVLRECLLRAPQDRGCLVIQTALLVANGDVEQARQTMERLRSSDAEFSMARERNSRRFGDSPLMERFLAELAQANAPETAQRKVKVGGA